MSLQDDIARYSSRRVVGLSRDSQIVRDITAGLERHWFMVKLADLPEVESVIDGIANFTDGARWHYDAYDAEETEEEVHRWVSLHLYAKARESEAAVLARRRDELARKLGCYPTPRHDWDGIPDSMERAIDRIIELEDQVAS